MSQNSSTLEMLQGSVRLLTYVNKENGYFVARVLVQGREQTLVGYSPLISVGEDFEAKGNWVSSKWGPQFKAKSVKLVKPSDTEGIARYLSNTVKGVGPAFAKKIVEALGTSAFDVIENDPEQLYSIKGLGRAKVAALISALSENKDARELEVFLFKLGLSKRNVNRVKARFGQKAIQLLTANPYLLCEVFWGIGFKKADEVALGNGVKPDSNFRIRAGILHCLSQAEGQGSCGMERARLLQTLSKLLSLPFPFLTPCLDELIALKDIYEFELNNVPCLFRARVAHVEQQIANRLLTHLKYPIAYPISNASTLINSREKVLGITLEAVQRDAVSVALQSQIAIITGGPGTGKTTITRVILESLNDSGLSKISLCAPTGKAARRASESTNFPATTIHRLLGRSNESGSFFHNEHNPLNVDVVVLDEASMADIYLFNALLAALPARARLLIIGDMDQLPSVGPGKVLADLINSTVFATVRLTQVFRQAATSQIIQMAHAINKGELPNLALPESSDFQFKEISALNPHDPQSQELARLNIKDSILSLIDELTQKGYDPIRDIQILAPTRKGILGVEQLNQILQKKLNPNVKQKLEHGELYFSPGDKVMQIRNNYDKEVYNGDVGYVAGVNLVARSMIVDFDGAMVEYAPEELDEIVLAYAYTIHKSQGSEGLVIIIPIDMSHFMLLRRNLIYTGVTRAKKQFYGIGSRYALQYAIERAQNEERWTMLKHWLQQSLPPALRPA